MFINDEFYYQQKDKWLRTGDMVMVQSGHVGHAAVIPENLDKTAAHALIMFTDQIEEIDPYFLNYQYQTTTAIKKISDITKGNTIKHILSSDMQNFVVNIPRVEEQARIAAFFRNLDNLITLHQRKLEKLRQIKKSILERMFVWGFDARNQRRKQSMVEIISLNCIVSAFWWLEMLLLRER